jgi:hypothetical protein
MPLPIAFSRGAAGAEHGPSSHEVLFRDNKDSGKVWFVFSLSHEQGAALLIHQELSVE